MPQQNETPDDRAVLEHDDVVIGRNGEPRIRRETVSFVRRTARLNSGQQRAWDEHRHRFLVDVPRRQTNTSVDPAWRLDVDGAFGRSAPLLIEVGSGRGEAIVAGGQANPDRNLLALEVYTPALAHTIRRINVAGIDNVRVAQANAPEVLEHALEPGSVDEFWTFFPDPWKKAKHTKRRLVSPSFVTLVHRVLRPGGLWRIATDWADYADQIENVVGADAGFEPLGENGRVPRFEGRVLTSFEQKAHVAGREIADFTYRRR